MEVDGSDDFSFSYRGDVQVREPLVFRCFSSSETRWRFVRKFRHCVGDHCFCSHFKRISQGVCTQLCFPLWKQCHQFLVLFWTSQARRGRNERNPLLVHCKLGWVLVRLHGLCLLGTSEGPHNNSQVICLFNLYHVILSACAPLYFWWCSTLISWDWDTPSVYIDVYYCWGFQV